MGQKITDFTELSAVPAVDDLVPIVDVSDTTEASTGTTKGIQYQNLKTIFGRQYSYGASASISSTTSTSFQQKLRLTTPSLPSGDYLIMYGYEWSTSNTSQRFKGRVQIDDSTAVMEHSQEPVSANAVDVLSGFVEATLSGVTNIDIDYASGGGGVTAYIRNARIVIWRVA